MSYYERRRTRSLVTKFLMLLKIGVLVFLELILVPSYFLVCPPHTFPFNKISNPFNATLWHFFFFVVIFSVILCFIFTSFFLFSKYSLVLLIITLFLLFSYLSWESWSLYRWLIVLLLPWVGHLLFDTPCASGTAWASIDSKCKYVQISPIAGWFLGW